MDFIDWKKEIAELSDRDLGLALVERAGQDTPFHEILMSESIARILCRLRG